MDLHAMFISYHMVITRRQRSSVTRGSAISANTRLHLNEGLRRAFVELLSEFGEAQHKFPTSNVSVFDMPRKRSECNLSTYQNNINTPIRFYKVYVRNRFELPLGVSIHYVTPDLSPYRAMTYTIFALDNGREAIIGIPRSSCQTNVVETI